MPGKEVIPPKATVDQSVCEHALAGPKTFRCPQCRGIMRRCCQTILSMHHQAICLTQLTEHT